MPSASKIASLIATADRLRQSPGSPLRGRNLALLRKENGYASSPLQDAAEELGARVALLNFSPKKGTSDARTDVTAFARMLGRMYDCIDCDGLNASVKRLVEQHAGVPVFPGLASDTHPARAIADLWTLCERQAPTERRIIFIGNGRGQRARLFVAAARTVGVAIVVRSRDVPRGEATPAIADASRPGDWILLIGDVEIDRGTVQECHRRIIQAMLVHRLLGA